MRISPVRPLFAVAAWLRMSVLLAFVLSTHAGTARAQLSLTDARFEEVRRASVTWDNRPGPARQVVDVVCLVPDVPTFLDALATWDSSHWFPILLDDAEYSLKFLRAFRPSRIVRFPKKVEPAAGEDLWKRAVAAIGRSWTTDDSAAPAGDARPANLGTLPPGVVVSNADSPTLAAGVALAAGRFQPLLKWQTTKHFGDVLPADDAKDLALGLEDHIARAIPKYDTLGDDCDFVTLAVDYPYAFQNKGEPLAVDDLIVRNAQTGKRWAFAGRLLGDPVASVYRAMCGLFLHPQSALLDNTYDQKEPPWTDYRMTTAARTLRKALPVTERDGEAAGLMGWHQTLDPVNPFGLILLNTHGGPDTFHLADGFAQTADIPETGPAVVLMVHSFSASAPTDPDTIAGRWLANGVYAFFGSMHEPYLQAFRTPTLAASFLAENLPVVVAERKLAGEIHAQPWRLVYFGDPLYRIRPLTATGRRLSTWEPVEGWPSYVEFLAPPADAPEALRLSWVVKTAVQNTRAGARKVDVTEVLLGMARDKLDAHHQRLYDALLIDALVLAGRRAEMIERLSQIAPEQRSTAVRRHLETAQTSALQRAAAARDLRQALGLWSGVIRARGGRGFVAMYTERVGRIAQASGRVMDWRARLRSASRDAPADNLPVIQAELKRLDAVKR